MHIRGLVQRFPNLRGGAHPKAVSGNVLHVKHEDDISLDPSFLCALFAKEASWVRPNVLGARKQAGHEA